MKTLKYTILAFALPFLVSCGADKTSATEEVEKEQTSNITTLTKAQFELGKMTLGTFTNQVFNRVVAANGVLDVPPENKSTVSVYFGGYVKNISLIQGQKIAKGQTLFTLENPDYIQVQQDFLEAKSQLNFLKSDYERQKDLASNNVSSQKTYLKAESDYKTTLAKYESLKKKLELMNFNPNAVTELNLSSIISIKAPISGYVTSVSATKGMFLNPSDIALTIINANNMHVELNIFEQDLANVAVGQEVSFSVQNGKIPFKAEVHLINKAIDSENRTIKVHCDLKNEKDALSLTPGMFVEAKIYASTDESFALPITAVESIENKTYVLVKIEGPKEELNFERIEVQVGQKNKYFVEILNTKDFKENTQFLTNGAFNLIQE